LGVEWLDGQFNTSLHEAKTVDADSVVQVNKRVVNASVASLSSNVCNDFELFGS
jgi:hypothetical protein